MRFPCGLLFGILAVLSISCGANSGIIVAPDNAATAMQGYTSAGFFSVLTLPATVWIVLAGLGALVYLIRHRH
jgi:hypothetical protein